MSKHNDLFSLPAAPPELCFDKNEFMKKTFSVDDFLHEHRNAASLETMRDDLGVYLKVLRSAMIELINEDYADFINLSTNLVGLDQQIDAIKNPLEQLNAEVDGVKQFIQESLDEIQICIDEKKKLWHCKHNLKCLAKVYESISKLTDLLEKQLRGGDVKPMILERAAMELVHLQFNVQFCSEYLDESRVTKPKELRRQILEKLQEYFLECLKTNTESLERCLRIYATLNEYEAAESVFRESVVGPYMDSRISENVLQNSSQGLVGIYNQVLDFISLHMKDLLLLTHHTDRVKGFNFLLNSFWRDVEHRLECNLSSIFAPGNPDTFFVKFKCTLGFLENIENVLGTDAAVYGLHEDPQYKSFQSRWNLPVYFQIRFQEIAGRLEKTCSYPLDDGIVNKDAVDLKCVIFKTALECILKLWSDGVYLEQLFPNFWKLTLQIISRTAFWVAESIKEFDEDPNEDVTLDRDPFLAILHRDAYHLMQHFPEILKIAVEKAPTIVHEHISELEECIEESRIQLYEQMSAIQEVLMKEIVTKSSASIKQVMDIPRLYRKTNRDVPSKHCLYVDLMLEPFKTFQANFQENIGADTIRGMFEKAYSQITVQYYKAIEEVLTSVQKTEESLRRLKNLREKSSTTSSSSQPSDRQGVSDDDKIRMQLQIDVLCWTREIEVGGIKRGSVEKLPEMIALVEDTAKSNRTSDK